MQAIVYPNNEGGIAIILPAPNCGLTLEEIARKDVPPIKRLVPSGIMKIDPETGEEYEAEHEVAEPRPYRIIDAADIPADRTFRDAWTADFSAPDGYGIGAEAGCAEQQEQGQSNDNG